MKRWNKNRINGKETRSIFVDAYGLKIQEQNYFTIRIRHEERPNIFWDWYHTTGSVVVNTNGYCRKCPPKILDPEELAIYIQNYS